MASKNSPPLEGWLRPQVEDGGGHAGLTTPPKILRISVAPPREGNFFVFHYHIFFKLNIFKTTKNPTTINKQPSTI